MNLPLTKLDEDGITVIVDPEYTPDTPEQARQIINQLLSEKLQLREALIRAGWLIAAQTGCNAPPFPRPDNLCGCNGCSEMIEMPKIVQALSTPPPPVPASRPPPPPSAPAGKLPLRSMNAICQISKKPSSNTWTPRGAWALLPALIPRQQPPTARRAKPPLNQCKLPPSPP